MRDVLLALKDCMTDLEVIEKEFVVMQEQATRFDVIEKELLTALQQKVEILGSPIVVLTNQGSTLVSREFGDYTYMKVSSEIRLTPEKIATLSSEDVELRIQIDAFHDYTAKRKDLVAECSVLKERESQIKSKIASLAVSIGPGVHLLDSSFAIHINRSHQCSLIPVI